MNNGEELDCDTVVLALGDKPNNDLYEALKDQDGVELVTVDGKPPKNAMFALRLAFMHNTNSWKQGFY